MKKAEDHLSTSKVAIAIIRLCFEAKQWDLLNQNLQVLSKRRAQLRAVIQDFVKEAMTYLDQIPEKSIKLELLNTLRTITEGKVCISFDLDDMTLSIDFC
jgi:26S proteasome regulatory subunit N5